jgi:hypothetical protein
LVIFKVDPVRPEIGHLGDGDAQIMAEEEPGLDDQGVDGPELADDRLVEGADLVAVARDHVAAVVEDRLREEQVGLDLDGRRVDRGDVEEVAAGVAGPPADASVRTGPPTPPVGMIVGNSGTRGSVAISRLSSIGIASYDCRERSRAIRLHPRSSRPKHRRAEAAHLARGRRGRG